MSYWFELAGDLII